MNSEIIDYIENNLENFFELTKHYRAEKDRLIEKDPIFKEEILEQFHDKVRFLVSLEITRDLGCSYEEALIAIQDTDLENLLN